MLPLRQLVQWMATTITVSEKTRRRLADYKRGGMTFDKVLNDLMDRVPIEDISTEQVREHHRRLKDFDGVPAAEFVAKLRKKR